MDSTQLLVAAIGLLVIISILGLATARRPASDPTGGLATSTEGMKVCAKCGMGNLWTESRCSSCKRPLRG